jgi:hypothetical protein
MDRVAPNLLGCSGRADAVQRPVLGDRRLARTGLRTDTSGALGFATTLRVTIAIASGASEVGSNPHHYRTLCADLIPIYHWFDQGRPECAQQALCDRATIWVDRRIAAQQS